MATRADPPDAQRYDQDLPEDITTARNLLERYSGVPPDQMEAHIHTVVCLSAIHRLLLPTTTLLWFPCHDHAIPKSLTLVSSSTARESVESPSLPLCRPIPLPRLLSLPSPSLSHSPFPSQRLLPDPTRSGLLLRTRYTQTGCRWRTQRKSLRCGSAPRVPRSGLRAIQG